MDQVDAAVPLASSAGGTRLELTKLERCRVAFRTLLSCAESLIRRILSHDWYFVGDLLPGPRVELVENPAFGTVGVRESSCTTSRGLIRPWMAGRPARSTAA